MDPAAAGRVDAVLLGARPALLDRRVEKLQPGTWAEFRPDGTYQVRLATGTSPGWPLDAAGRAGRRSRRGRRAVGHRPSGCGRAGVQLPVGGTGLQHRHRAGQAGQPRSRRLHHHVPARRITVWRRCRTTRLYARKVADRYGIRLHEIQIAPDIVEILPRMVGILDEPIGDPAAINTLLMCEAARDAGVKVILSGMGADELFGGYRKHLACVMAARYRRLPGSAARAAAGTVDRLPVAMAGRGLRHVRWAKRFLTFSELPEEAAFRRSYTLYDPATWRTSSIRSSGRKSMM